MEYPKEYQPGVSPIAGLVAASVGPHPAIVLTPEERQLVLEHRALQRKREDNLQAEINEAISVALAPHITQSWSNWPGTNTLARAVFHRLKVNGHLKL
jgi:hypothetical protein